MKKTYVADLAAQEGQVVRDFFLVQFREVRTTREGKPYLALWLADRTGSVEARLWDGLPEGDPGFDRSDVVKIEGRVETYRGRAQLKLQRIERARPQEADPADFLPRTTKDVEALYAELLAAARGLKNVHLQKLALAVLEDPELAGRLKRAPGAKTVHHAYLGGLLEHVVSLCRLCRLVAPNYEGVDLDLLLSGALLHDLGKIYELSYDGAFDYTTEGNLLGHITMEIQVVGRKMDALEFPPRLRALVEHMLLSHHGQLEFGSPVVPKFPEAMLLHYLDDLDSKMETMRATLAAADAAGLEGDWTPFVRSLERSLLRKEKFLEGKSAPAGAPQATLFDSGRARPAKKE